jgi:23S rRNA (adenine2503-C2)-methyltransferase
LEDLIDACRYYCSSTGRRIFVEWTLIAGRNDTEEQARQLTSLLAGIEAHVNLIPLNPTTGFSGVATVAASASAFQQAILRSGIPCTVRQRRGIDVAAGCGQLQAEKNPRHGTHQERSSDL